MHVGSLDPNEPAIPLLDDATNVQFANGHLIFVRDGRLMAQPFNLERRQLEAGTSPAMLAEGVQDRGGGAAFSVAGNGAIAYQAVVPVPMQLEWLDREGRRLGTLGGVEDYGEVALSPDGSRAAVSMLDPSAGTHDIWIFDVKRGSESGSLPIRGTTSPPCGRPMAIAWSTRLFERDSPSCTKPRPPAPIEPRSYRSPGSTSGSSPRTGRRTGPF